MSVEDADYLQGLFEQQQSLTTWHEMAVQRTVELWRALRENDVNTLKARAGWDTDRDYVPDALAEKISTTFADMLFGEDPIIKTAQTVQKEIRQATEAKARAAEAGNTVSPGEPPKDVQDQQRAGITPEERQIVTRERGAPTNDEQAPGQSIELTDTRLEQAAVAGPTEQEQYDLPADDHIDDQDLINNIIEANELASELWFAEVISSSEGEVWWRIYIDHGQSDYPIIEWHSRSHVRPLYRGRELIAAAFVSEIHREEVESQWIVWRYVEIHAAGVVRNLLYKGTPTILGTSRSLTERPETQFLEPEWEHDLGILCGRVYNKLGRDRRVGMSDFHNIVDLLFSLNEATTIGHENMRLTAKKRIAVPREAIGEDGTFDASEDVLIMDEPLDDQLGTKTGGGRFAVLEYSFDATSLIEHKLDLIATILSRVGIVAEFASAGGGARSSGMGGVAALTGTALRMRLIPTTLAAKGKARPWDVELPRILMKAQQVDSLPEERGGFGRNWAFPNEPPSVERGEPIPTDESEETQRHVSAVGAEISSRKSAIQELHPTWDEDQVQEELEQILLELKTFGPPKTVGGGRNGSGGLAVGMNAGIVDTSG